MANPLDYTTLDTLKAYISPSMLKSDDSNVVLCEIITAVSNSIDKYLSRIMMSQSYVEYRHGNNRESMRTNNYPIITVQALLVNGQGVAAAVGAVGPGFLNDDKFIFLRGGVPGGRGGLYYGHCFPKGILNIEIDYTSGYLTPGQIAIENSPVWQSGQRELLTNQILPGNGYLYTCIQSGITGSTPPTFNTTLGSLVTDANVVWQNSGPWFTPPNNADVLPEQLTNACCIQAAYMYAMKPRIGDTATGEAQQRVSYMVRDWHPAVKEKIDPFRKVVPTGNYS